MAAKELMQLVPVAIALGAAGIVIGVMADVLTDQRDKCTNTTAGIGEENYCGYQIYGNATEGTGELASYLPTIGTVAALGLVIAVLLGIFMRRGR